MIGGNVKTMPGAKVVGAIGLTGAIAGADDASGTKEAVRGGAAVGVELVMPGEAGLLGASE